MAVEQYSSNRGNTTIIKKNKKIVKYLSQMNYYSYYKRGHYINKCPDKYLKD